MAGKPPPDKQPAQPVRHPSYPWVVLNPESVAAAPVPAAAEVPKPPRKRPRQDYEQPPAVPAPNKEQPERLKIRFKNLGVSALEPPPPPPPPAVVESDIKFLADLTERMRLQSSERESFLQDRVLLHNYQEKLAAKEQEVHNLKKEVGSLRGHMTSAAVSARKRETHLVKENAGLRSENARLCTEKAELMAENVRLIEENAALPNTRSRSLSPQNAVVLQSTDFNPSLSTVTGAQQEACSYNSAGRNWKPGRPRSATTGDALTELRGQIRTMVDDRAKNVSVGLSPVSKPGEPSTQISK